MHDRNPPAACFGGRRARRRGLGRAALLDHAVAIDGAATQATKHLFIMANEHRRDALGCSGDPVARAPPGSPGGGREAPLALADSDFSFTPLTNIAGDLALAERTDLLREGRLR